MSKTYLFYDTETSGTHHCFDQILQFAAIHTDENLTPLENGEIEFRIKLRPDIIPSPGALLTTNMHITQLHDGLTEYEAIQQIHQLVNQPHTISAGYNLFAFDDLMLRFAFHRNLLDPYTHQYSNGCGRLDILPIVTLYYLYKPELLRWPKVDGKTKLKLELLNVENNLATGDAHDALVDVRVTIALVQRLKQQAPKMWDFCLNFFEQNWVASQLAQSAGTITGRDQTIYKEALLVASGHGAKNNFQKHALLLGYDTSKQKRANWLLLDQVDLASVTDLSKFPLLRSKKIDEPPLVVPYTAERDKRPAEKENLSHKNRAWLQQHADLLPQLLEQTAANNYTASPHPIDADANLYDAGFPSTADKQLFYQFHSSTLAAKQRLIAQIHCPVRQELATRILFRNFEQAHLDAPFQSIAEAYLRSVAPQGNISALFDYRGQQRTTPYKALAELEQHRQNPDLSASDHEILNGLEKYILDTFIYPYQHDR